jgi:GT2 family glycosyltransferase
MTDATKRPCALCGSVASTYLFMRHDVPVFRCQDCGLTRLAESQTAVADSIPPALTTGKAAGDCLAALHDRGAPPSGLLAIAADGDPFLSAAAGQGFTVAARVGIEHVESGSLAGTTYESAAVLLQLEKARNPVGALEQIHRVLSPDGVLLVLTSPAEWRADTRSSFDAQTIQSACLRAGFAFVEFSRAPPDGFLVTARRVSLPPRPLLSVVMPVFNERATFEKTLHAVLAKECIGVDKEVVIVESGSTDGTRELVSRYEGHPGITVVFEDRPRGKGAAVRTGLARATGTIVLIQDADSEYDVNDYDALLEPIVTYRRAFVLGSRHIGSWKMRRFADQPAVSAFFNFGHVLFRAALNAIYGQNIKDPFTMYKVFRRDCLHRLKFECNRFDFDFELVIKLLRKGYVPLEVPVNYASRSFKEGKKVSAWRDPLTWIRALAKYRFASIYDDREKRS